MMNGKYACVLLGGRGDGKVEESDWDSTEGRISQLKTNCLLFPKNNLKVPVDRGLIFSFGAEFDVCFLCCLKNYAKDFFKYKLLIYG